jgi:acyl carrier protein
MNDIEIIKKCLKKIKGDQFDIEKGLITDGWIDSFGLLKLVKILEEDADIKIPVDEIRIENFDDIDSIQKLVNKMM